MAFRVSRTNVSLWFTASRPALTFVFTLRPCGFAGVRTSVSLWFAANLPALVFVFTFMMDLPFLVPVGPRPGTTLAPGAGGHVSFYRAIQNSGAKRLT